MVATAELEGDLHYDYARVWPEATKYEWKPNERIN